MAKPNYAFQKRQRELAKKQKKEEKKKQKEAAAGTPARCASGAARRTLAMLQLANVGPEDYVIDLGSGERIFIASVVPSGLAECAS